MIYEVCTTLLLIGILGLVAQVLLGGAHTGHTGHGGDSGGHGGHGGHGHGGHGHGELGSLGGGGRGIHGGGGGDRGSRGERSASFFLTLLSPLVFFSLCIGSGGTGLLVKHFHFPTMLVVFVGLTGGALFYGLLIRPMWSLVYQFASKPSTALEGTVAGEAEAVSGFNSEGKGLVKLTIDGQLVQVLATLEDDDRPDASAIKRGDRLTVTSVDGRTNSCHVARL